MPISVVIVDDNEGTRSLLRALAQRDDRLEIVGEAANGLEAVTAVREFRPDAIVLDIMMPVVTGLDAIPDILELAPETRIVGYSAYEGHREQALELGAHGWVTKGQPWDHLVETILELVVARDGIVDGSLDG